jgi:hypothetical protein
LGRHRPTNFVERHAGKTTSLRSNWLAAHALRHEAEALIQSATKLWEPRTASFSALGAHLRCIFDAI